MKDPFEELVGVRGTTAASAGVSQTQTASARNVTVSLILLSCVKVMATVLAFKRGA